LPMIPFSISSRVVDDPMGNRPSSSLVYSANIESINIFIDLEASVPSLPIKYPIPIFLHQLSIALSKMLADWQLVRFNVIIFSKSP
jgi:hypothetical protein